MIPKGIPLRNMNNDKMSQIIKPEIQPLEPAEIDQMLKEAKKDDYCNLFITVLFIGMHQEELRGCPGSMWILTLESSL